MHKAKPDRTEKWKKNPQLKLAILILLCLKSIEQVDIQLTIKRCWPGWHV